MKERRREANIDSALVAPVSGRKSGRTPIATALHGARLRWGWALFYTGLAIIVIEILSRIQFLMDMRTSNLLLMLGMVAAGIGMMLRSFRDASQDTRTASDDAQVAGNQEQNRRTTS